MVKSSISISLEMRILLRICYVFVPTISQSLESFDGYEFDDLFSLLHHGLNFNHFAIFQKASRYLLKEKMPLI